MLVLLVGPKGSGKSHIGRVLEARLGVRFFRVEPLWMAYYAACRSAGREPVIAEGIAEVHPAIAAALREHEHVSVETTGASGEILADLLTRAPRSETVIVRVSAPLALCLERIAARDRTNQIPMDVEMIRKVHALSETLQLEADVALANAGLGEEEVVARFAPLLTAWRQRDVDELASCFVAGTLPRGQWTHLMHLAIGTWHVHRYGPEEAMTRLRTGIRHLNGRHGTPNSATSGYHETITRAYVQLLAAFLDGCPAATSVAERVARVIDGPLADQAVLLKFYSRGRLMSPSARATWVEPDVAPLPALVGDARGVR